MVVPISPISEKAPQGPVEPSAPELSPSHIASNDEHTFGLSHIEFAGYERSPFDSSLLRHLHFANFIRENQSNVVNNVLRLHNVKKTGFELYLSYLDYNSIKFCSLEDALLCLETSYILTCLGLYQLATESVDFRLNSNNLWQVLKVFASMSRQRRRLNPAIEDELKIFQLYNALAENCKEISKSCCKEILLSVELQRIPKEDALLIFRLLDLSPIKNGKVIITEGEFLLGPAKVLPENEYNSLHKLIKSRRSKVSENVNHVYHLSERTKNGCPINCDPVSCCKIRCCSPDKNQKDDNGKERKTTSQKVVYGLCRCWQIVFD